MADPSKDFVRQHEQQQRRQAQHQMDTSDRPWEHSNNPLLRRQRNHFRQLLILVGIAIVLGVVLMVLLGSSGSPTGS